MGSQVSIKKYLFLELSGKRNSSIDHIKTQALTPPAIKSSLQDNIVLLWVRETKSHPASVYSLIKSTHLIKFYPTLENPDHWENSFLNVPLLQTFCNFPEPYFVLYSLPIQK